jgi:hypothetical protein
MKSAVSNPFAHLWLFILAVWVHAITLAAGCVVTVGINLFEKHILKRTIPLKVDLAILLAFVFFACFQAWRDQYERVTTVQATPTIHVAMPPITIPPATVIIQQTAAAPRDLTGFLEIVKIEAAQDQSAIAGGQLIGFNYFLENRGTQPVHDVHNADVEGIVDMSEPNPEHSFVLKAQEAQKSAFRKIISEKAQGDEIGVGPSNFPSYRHSQIDLNTIQADGVMAGTFRIYLMVLVKWKDSHNRLGTLAGCYWLSKPPGRELLHQNLTWGGCKEPL